jgi:hypothetical protein
MRSSRRFPRLTRGTLKKRPFRKLGQFAGRDPARRSRHLKRYPKRVPRGFLKNDPRKKGLLLNNPLKALPPKNSPQPCGLPPSVRDSPVAAAVVAVAADAVAADASRPWRSPLLPLP